MTKIRKRRLRWGRIILLVSVLALFFSYILYQQHLRNEARRQIEINRQVVRAMELKSVTEIEAKLREIREEYGIGKIDVAEIPNRKYFEDAIFMGDSITQSISLYDQLPPSNVVATVGRNTQTALADVPLLANLSPARIFLWYGMNDLQVFSGAGAFKTSYQTLIDAIETTLPQTEIVLLSLLPSSSAAIKKQPALAKARMTEFNQAIRDLAESGDHIYIDISPIVSGDYYEPDGIHVKRGFYDLLFNHIKREFIDRR